MSFMLHVLYIATFSFEVFVFKPQISSLCFEGEYFITIVLEAFVCFYSVIY